MLTTVFGAAIVAEAQRWLALECHEDNIRYDDKNPKEGSNYVVCDRANNPKERIKWKVFGGKVQAAYWCAAFAYEVVSSAAANVKMELPFAKEVRAMASVTNWQNLGKYGAKRDNKPVPGSVLIIKTKETKTTKARSHVGIVIKVNDNGTIQTIEGNSEQKVRLVEYNNPNTVSKYEYAHVEELFPELKGMDTPVVNIPLTYPVVDGEANPPQEDTDADPIIKAAPILQPYVAPPVPQKGGTVSPTPQPQKPQHTGRRREWR